DSESAIPADVDLIAVESLLTVGDSLDTVIPVEVQVPPAAGADFVGVGQRDPVVGAPAIELAGLVFVEDDEVAWSAGDADVGQAAAIPGVLDHLRSGGDRPSLPFAGGMLAADPVAR